jgi:hypothetical protein
LGANTGLGDSVSFVNPNRPYQYSNRVNIGFETRAKSSAEVLQNETKAAGIGSAFEANPGSAEFQVNRARAGPGMSDHLCDP